MGPTGSVPATLPIVFFDGHCGLCNRFVNFLIRRDKKMKLKFATLQGSTAKAMIPGAIRESLETVIFYKDGKWFQRSSAGIRLFMELGSGWKLMSVFLLCPPFLRDAVYRFIARRRYRIWGHNETCRIPGPDEKKRFLD